MLMDTALLQITRDEIFTLEQRMGPVSGLGIFCRRITTWVNNFATVQKIECRMPSTTSLLVTLTTIPSSISTATLETELLLGVLTCTRYGEIDWGTVDMMSHVLILGFCRKLGINFPMSTLSL